MKNQKNHWNNLHQKQFLQPFSNNETIFAQEVIKYFPKLAKILELGCGAGNDSAFFAKKGFEIIATDFSEAAIEQNKKTYNQFPSLNFQILDISQPFSFNDKTFDVIYARLSLHYFTDKKNQRNF